MIVDSLWQTRGWQNLSVLSIDAFWEDAAQSDLTVREFIEAKRHEFA